MKEYVWHVSHAKNIHSNYPRSKNLFLINTDIFWKIEKSSLARHHKKLSKDLHLYLHGSSRIASAFSNSGRTLF